jgi:hypothetical protein
MTRRGTAALAFVLLVISGCRTARPTGEPLAPLTATTPEEARAQLQERRAAFHGVESLMRIRATTRGETQSFRATLAIEDARSMRLTAFTPVGTTALTLESVGDHVRLKNFIEHSEWEGPARDLGRTLGLFGSELLPSEMAMLLTGLPPRDDLDYRFEAAGLAGAAFGGMTVTFDPPSFPARRVTVLRGADRIEIEHLEIVQ